MNTINTIVLASNNQGKVREINQLIADSGIEIIPQSEFSVPEVAETGLSFVENAIIKARHACQYCDLPVIADDSGLEVDALKKQPGIYSARYAGADSSDQANLEKLLQQLQGTPKNQRSARFQCVMVLMQTANDPTPIICQARWEGYITEQAIGDNGFGYDPVFFIPEKNCTSAQLSASEKNRLSHRGQALVQLKQQLQKIYRN